MENQNLKMTPKVFFQSLNVIYLGLLSGMILLPIFFFFIVESKNFNFDLGNILLVILLLLAIAGVFVSNILYTKSVAKIENGDSLKEKLQKIQGAMIVKYFAVELPALIGAVLFMRDGNYVYLIVTSALILVFITLKPNKERILEDMKLTPEQRQQMSKEDQPI